MANINLAIDIDTHDVTQADAAIDRLTDAVKGLEAASHKLASAAEQSDNRIRKVADATKQADSRTAAAVAQYQKLTAVWASLGAIVGGAMIGGLVQLSDQYTEITNKLRVVSDEQADVNALFEQLLDVANRTRTPIEAMATLYQRVSLAANELGASQKDVLAFSENIGKALALQGGSAEAASGALLQLSQALGGGIVRAEEFNSVLEGAFPIAQAAAKGIEAAGGSVAKLRTLVIEGKVSSDEFFQAILSQTADLEAAFARTTPTIGQAFTVLRNNMISLSKETQGIMSVLAQGIILVADNLERLATYAATAAAIFGAKLAAGLVASAVATGSLSGALTVLRGALIRTGVGALVVGAGELVYQFLQLVKATGGWGEALALLGEVASGVWEGIKTSASAIGPALGAVWAGIKADFLTMVQGLAAAWANFLDSVNIGGALDGAIASARDAISSLGDAIIQADSNAARLSSTANDRLGEGFAKAAEAVGKLRDKVKESEGSLGGASTAAGTLGTGLDKAAGSAKKMADELKRAKDVLDDQVTAHQRVLDQLKGAATETGYVADETQKLEEALKGTGVSMDAFLKSVSMTRDEYTRMLGETEKVTAQIDYQAKAADAMVSSLKGLAFGSMDAGEAIGGVFQSITDGAFGQQLDDAFKKAANTLSDTLGDALSGLGQTGLSDFGMASVGTGIGIAAAGALNGNAQQIGSGIGSAIGGVAGDAIGQALGGSIGSFAGPIGMVLGSVAGGFISKLFGKDSTWTTANVEAFAGTSYASNVEARYNTDNPDPTPAARAAVLGTMNLLKDFNSELKEYIESLGGTAKAGSDLVVNQTKALKAITGVIDDGDVPRAGAEAEKIAAEISAKLATIMGIAATIASKAGPPLTQAQQLWRETQEKFSEENVAILRSLGFTAKQLYQAQGAIKRDLAQGFNKEQLDALVDTGRATREELDKWKAAEIASLNERRAASLATAKEIGGDVALVQSSFRAQRRDIVAEWRDMLDDMTEEVMSASQRAAAARQSDLGMLNTIVGGDRATKATVDEWKKYQLAALEEQRQAALKNAREIGASQKLVNLAFAGQRDEIVGKWKDLLQGLVKETEQVAKVTRSERLSFRGGALDELVQGGDTGALDEWLRVNRAILIQQRKDQVAEAKRLGVDVTLIRRLYDRKLLDVEKEFAERRYQSVVDAATSALERLNSRLNGLESQRSEVLQELTQRADDARRAEQALADARAGLAASDLNPGGPMDRFRALQGQFGAAVKAARGGDTDAASQAASLAQSLLEAGRGVYASGTGYADLFRNVNQQLLAAQKGLGSTATTIEKGLDASTFVKENERSTKALLTALGKLDTSIGAVERQIARQTRRQELAQQRQSVGVK